jgi:uncharacterized protein YbcC (UPF0753/DUF2309 family)
MTFDPFEKNDLRKAVDHAARAIPPAWPLASSVAVNPFLGQSGDSLALVGARLARVAGVRVIMPRGWFLDRMARGLISETDLAEALANAPALPERPADVASLKAAAEVPQATIQPLPTVADLAAGIAGIDWPGLLAERIGAWAAGYFDEGQALWAAPRGQSAYAAWRAAATLDLTPEIMGLTGFATFVSQTPETAPEALRRASGQLGLGTDGLDTYFHQLLLGLGGWAQYARYRLWQAELAGQTDATITDLLTIRLLWEAALFDCYGEPLARQWEKVLTAHASALAPSRDMVIDEILQDAAERGFQRGLGAVFVPQVRPVETRPVLQAAFCIDVRSEVLRRHLEATNTGIQTIGFAGFFGLALAHRRFASDVSELRLPVLLAPALKTCSGGPAMLALDQEARLKARAKRAWGRFRLAAVSSFAFVEAAGPLYGMSLLRKASGYAAKPVALDPPPRPEHALDLAARIEAAHTVLRAMSLTRNFAPLVLLVGHGATVVNNAQASALHCGACGGYAGDVNARLLATLLNDQDVRAGLVSRGVCVPEDTLFLAALHDTTSDEVTIYSEDHPSEAHRKALGATKGWFRIAAKAARSERAPRLPRAVNERGISRRSRDWSEVRPEWALAGCGAFVAAPRLRTQGRNLEGRVFLHDYDWRQDQQFRVLELIMTAPMVVASWISLQYYGSTVAPQLFGSGNKLLHNVSGGIGVFEGNGGLLRAGLAWQSVHDGERLVHEPLRLSVCIEAPHEAMTDVLQRHQHVRDLCDNRWLHLFALDDAGQMAWRYAGGLQWRATAEATHASSLGHGQVRADSERESIDFAR